MSDDEQRWVLSDGRRPFGIRDSDRIERERHNGSTAICRVDEAYWPNTKRWRLVNQQQKENIMTKTFIHKFKAGTVVERNAFNALSNDKLAETAAELYKEGEPTPIFVGSVADFFSKTNLLKQITDNGEYLPILLEKWDIELTPDELEILNKFTSVRAGIVAKVDGLKNKYPFADVPDNWSIEKNIRFKGTSVTRPTTNYSIGVKTLKGLWLKVNKSWSGEGDLPRGYQNINASGYSRDVTYRADRIDIGCQTIHRYELEQVALHFGWEFPE